MALKAYSMLTGVSLNHFYAKSLNEALETIKVKISKYENLKEVERNPKVFVDICSKTDVITGAFTSIFQFCIDVLNRESRNENTIMVSNLYRTGKFILKLLHEILHLEKYVSCFEDLIYPILSASSNVS